MSEMLGGALMDVAKLFLCHSEDEERSGFLSLNFIMSEWPSVARPLFCRLEDSEPDTYLRYLELMRRGFSERFRRDI